MGTPNDTLMIIGYAAKGAQLLASGVGATAEQEALNLRSKQENLRHQQETLKNLDLMEKTLDRQVVQAVARGVSVNSPSFLAIREETYRKGAKAEKNQEIESSIMQSNIDTEKSNVKTSLFAKMFGETAELGFDYAKYQSALPMVKGA